MTTYRVLSLMAGSSADGATMALLNLSQVSSEWRYALLEGITVPYPEALRTALLTLQKLSAEALLQLSIDYTDWTAQAINTLYKGRWRGDFLAWHPHTVYHAPLKGLTWSLGDAERLRVLIGMPVISHFRARDIAAGGTGAPLIPVADESLFVSYETLVNLGGIANLTHLPTHVAYDVGPCNQLLNALVQEVEPILSYDPEGQLARQGHWVPALAEQWKAHPFFCQPPPKALDNLTVQQEFILPFRRYPADPIDKLHTATRCIAELIGSELQKVGARHFTLTGGGAHNTYLVEEIVRHTERRGIAYSPAPPEMVEYREAIGFGFLALRRWLGFANTYPHWTGSKGAQSSGSLSL